MPDKGDRQRWKRQMKPMMIILRSLTVAASLLLLIMVLPEWIEGYTPIYTRMAIAVALVLSLVPFSLVRRSRLIANIVWLGLLGVGSIFLVAALGDSTMMTEGVLIGAALFGTPAAIFLDRRMKRRASNQASHATSEPAPGADSSVHEG